MALTGRFQFRKSFWGRIVLQLEEEVKPLWSRSKPNALKRRWRDAKLMDLADPALRPLIDMRSKPPPDGAECVGVGSGACAT
jgi:hypothetical protein